jgi:hypothetical protein
VVQKVLFGKLLIARVVKCLRLKNLEVCNSFHKSPSLYPNLRQCSQTRFSNPFPKVRHNALLLFAAYPGGGPPNGPRLLDYKIVSIPHSDIQHVFQSLEQTVSDLRKGPVPEFFHVTLNLRQLELTSPTYLSHLFGYVCPFTSGYTLKMLFV